MGGCCRPYIFKRKDYMRKFISITLIFAMLISLCAATTVAAAEKTWVIDTVNNTYTNHFDGATHTERYDESGGYCRNTSTNYTIPAGDSDTALKMESKISESLSSQWQTRVDTTTALVTGTKLQMSFDFRIDGSSMTTAEPKVMRFRSGTSTGEWSEFLMKIKHNGTNWDITFVNTDYNDYDVLCSVAADTWQKITLIFDLENGTYDAYAGGNVLSDMMLLESSQDTGNTTDADKVITRADISDVQFHNCGVYSFANSVATTHDSIYYVDNIELCQYNTPQFTKSYIVAFNGEEVSDTSSVSAMDTLYLKFNKDVETFNLTLNGETVSNSDIKSKGNGAYAYEPSVPLLWNTTYTLAGTATDVTGENCIVTDYSFTLMQQPANIIQVIGFYDSDGKKLSELTSGNITAKLRFWQTANSTYTYMLVMTKTTSGKLQKVKVAADKTEAVAGAGYTEKTVTINVPSDYENSTVRLLVWDNLVNRVPYQQNVFAGVRELG